MPTLAREARTIRAAESQSLFRGINEQIQDLGECSANLNEVAEWVCECADTGCTNRMLLTTYEYEALRRDGTRFAVAPGHEVPDVEVTVDATERYAIVRMIGAAADRARGLDPRGT